MTGLYRISFDGEPRFYIGSSINIDRRFFQHRYRLRRGDHHCRDMQEAFDRLGEGAMRYEVVAKMPAEDMFAAETKMLRENAGRLLNSHAGVTHNRTGEKMPEEWVEGLREKMKGNNYRAGIEHDDAARARIGEGLRRAYREGRRKPAPNPQNLAAFNAALKSGEIDHPKKNSDRDAAIVAHYRKNWSLKEAGAAFGISPSAAGIAVKRSTGKGAMQIRKEKECI